jgi:ABC-type antimicrobial peptide transport system permease subunit
VGKPRFVTTVFAAFSGLALALAAIGLFGALSYNVSARKRELGIRAALGAGRGDLVGLVVRQGLAVTVAGLTLGLPAAAAASRVMAGLLFGVSPWDAVAFSVAVLLVLLVAGAACIIPARRAASTEPARVLRTE